MLGALSSVVGAVLLTAAVLVALLAEWRAERPAPSFRHGRPDQQGGRRTAVNQTLLLGALVAGAAVAVLLRFWAYAV